MDFTRVTYMYRDASNYKFHGEFVVSGKLQKSHLEKFLFDGEFFVPHEVGLNHLLDVPMNEDDHHLHTFEHFEPCRSSKAVCSAKDFIRRTSEANLKGWFSSFR